MSATIVTNLSALDQVKMKLQAGALVQTVDIGASFTLPIQFWPPIYNGVLQGHCQIFNQRMAEIGGYGGRFLTPYMTPAIAGGALASGIPLHAYDWTTAGFSAGLDGGLGFSRYSKTGTTASTDISPTCFYGRYLDILYSAVPGSAAGVLNVSVNNGATHSINQQVAAAVDADWGTVYTLDAGVDGYHFVTFHREATAGSTTCTLEGIRSRMSHGHGYIAHSCGVISAQGVFQQDTWIQAGSTTPIKTNRALALIGAAMRSDGTRLMIPDWVTFDLGGNDWDALLTTAGGTFNSTTYAAAVASYCAAITRVFTVWASINVPVIFKVYPRRKTDAGNAYNGGAASDAFFQAGLAAAQAAYVAAGAGNLVVGWDATGRFGGTLSGASAYYSSAHPTALGNSLLADDMLTSLGFDTLAGVTVRDNITVGASAGFDSGLASVLSGASLVWHKSDTGPGAFIVTQDSAGNNIDVSAYYSSVSVVYQRSGHADVVQAAAMATGIPPGETVAQFGVSTGCPPTDIVGTLTVLVRFVTPGGIIETAPNPLTWSVAA